MDEIKMGDLVERTGWDAGWIVGGGFERTTVNGETSTEEASLSMPVLKTSIVTDGKTQEQTMQQSADLIGFKVGVGVVGVDLGLSYKVEQSTKERTTNYNGNMNLQGKVNSNSDKNGKSKVTWSGTSAENAKKMKNFLKSIAQ